MINFPKFVKAVLIAIPAMIGMLDSAKVHASTESVDVVIVGGGPGGLHTAWRLTNPPVGANTGVNPEKVVVLEKSDRLGGRIEDVRFGPGPNDVAGTGAYRMYDNHYTYFLMQELGVDTNIQADFTVLYGMQSPPCGDGGNYFGYADSEFQNLYCASQTPDDIWEALLCGPNVVKDNDGNPIYEEIPGIGNKSSLQYLKDTVNNDHKDSKYFLDTYRFKGDFLNPVDAASYMNYNAADFAGGDIYYANPGFSAAITAMKNATEEQGGRIYLNEGVTSIDENKDGTFSVKTKHKKFKANYVIIATEHGAIKNIKGDVPEAIVKQKEYKYIQPVQAITVTHQWNRKWWNEDLRYPNLSRLADGQLPDGADPILRDVTNLTVDGLTINTSELPVFQHWDDLNVVRSMYTDIPDQTEAWLKLYSKEGIESVNEKIITSLRILYPDLFDGSPNEPQILKSHLTLHKEGWYFLKKNALANGITLPSLLQWSLRPLSNKNVHLVGDAWKPVASGWSAATFMSSQTVLNSFFGMNVNTHELGRITCDP